MIIVATAAVLNAAGCRGEQSDAPPRQFFPGLDDQPKYKAQAESRFFRDYVVPEGEKDAGMRYGRTMRDPVPGTVAFGRSLNTEDLAAYTNRGELTQINYQQQRADLVALDPRIYRGREVDGSWVSTVPVPVDKALMQLGEEQFNIYCIVCHGGTAVGGGEAGMVGLRWQYAIPNLHGEQYQLGSDGEQAQDGYLFDIIRNGLKNTPGSALEYRMPPYGHKINEHEAWAIVAYLRALQYARNAPLEEATESERLELERTRGGNASSADNADTNQNGSTDG
ncbi:MAG: c-type cytochrome [Planctomycetota bacterium]